MRRGWVPLLIAFDDGMGSRKELLINECNIEAVDRGENNTSIVRMTSGRIYHVVNYTYEQWLNDLHKNG